MSIDMKSYAGDREPPAAVEQQPLNQFQRESLDEGYPVPPMPEQETTPEPIAQDPPVAVQEDPQERNFRALSESVEKLKAEREAEKREHQLQLDMLRVNLARSHQQDAPKPKAMFDGMEDNDVPNVGELRRAWTEREMAYNAKIEELQVASTNPDYAEVLNKYGKILAEKDPAFLQGLQGAENKALFAYNYAKKEQRIQELEETIRTSSKPAPTQQSMNAQKIVDNARKPGTLAQTGGQGALSKADYYASMGDAEFMKMASKHLESI